MKFDPQKFLFTALTSFALELLFWVAAKNNFAGQNANVLLVFFLLATLVGALFATTRNRN